MLEVERLLETAKQDGVLPKYLLLENVKNLVGKQFRQDFDRWLNKLEQLGYKVIATDIVDRGCVNTGIEDFFKANPVNKTTADIITNPPYKYAREFVEHALEIVDDGIKVAMFLKLTFLESKGRKALFEKYPPKRIWVFSERVQCAKNGDFEKYKKGVGTAVAYAWFVWEKGYQGKPTLSWI